MTIFFIIVWCRPSSGKWVYRTSEMFWTTLLGPNHLLTVVTARVTAGVMCKNKLATLGENWSGDETDSLGYIPVCVSWAGGNLNSSYVNIVFSCVLTLNHDQILHTKAKLTTPPEWQLFLIQNIQNWLSNLYHYHYMLISDFFSLSLSLSLSLYLSISVYI